MVRRLRGRIELDDDTEEGARSAKGNLDELRDAFGVPSLGKLGVAGAAAGAGTAIVAFGAKLVENAAELRTLSEVSGLGVEDLQRWGQAAAEGGGSAEDAADAARELQLRLAEATSLGSGPAVDALDLLGLSLDDLADKPVAERLEIIRDRLSEVEDESQRLFLAEELLGGSAERLNTAIGATTEQFNAQNIASAHSIESLAGLESRFSVLADRVRNEATEALVGFAEILGIIEREAAPDATASIENFESQLDTLIRELEEAVNAIDEETQAHARSGRQIDLVTESIEANIAALERQIAALREAEGADRIHFQQAEASAQAAIEAAEAYDTQRYALGRLAGEAIYAADALYLQAQASSVANAAADGLLPEDIIRQTEGFGYLPSTQIQRDRYDAFGRDSGGGGRGGGGGSGGGGSSGSGGGGSTARPERVRLGDYLVDQGELSNDELDVLSRFGTRNRYGSGRNRGINLNQNIAELSDDELRELLLDVGDAQQDAEQRRADVLRDAAIAEALAREQRVEDYMRRTAEQLERTGASPCPPIQAGSIIAERTLVDTLEAVRQEVQPDPTSPLTGTAGNAVVP